MFNSDAIICLQRLGNAKPNARDKYNFSEDIPNPVIPGGYHFEFTERE